MISFLRVVVYSVVSLCLLLLVLAPFLWVVNSVLTPLILLLGLTLPFSISILPWFIVLFFTSGLVLYFLTDYFAGFTYRSLLKDLQPVGTSFPFWKDHQEICERFGLKKTELFVQDGVFNAFALQSPSRKGIVLGQTLMDKFQSAATDDQEFQEAIRGVLGHECSHLRSGDYFPTWIYLAAQNVLTAFQAAFLSVLQFIGNVLGLIPFVGPLFGKGFQFLQQGLGFLFVKIRDVLLPFLLKLLDSWLCRQMEFRCDHQSSQVVGAKANLLTQKFLTLFSGSTKRSLLDSHPESTARVLRVFHLTRKVPHGLQKTPSLGTALGALVLVVTWFTFTWYSLEKVHFLPSQISPSLDVLAEESFQGLTVVWQTLFSFWAAPVAQAVLAVAETILGATVGIWNAGAGFYDQFFGPETGSLSDILRFLASVGGVLAVAVTAWFGLRLVSDLFVTYCLWEPVKLWVKPRLNRTDGTPIDFLLEYSALRNSRLAAFQALWHGALVTAAPEQTTKRMKRFFRGLK